MRLVMVINAIARSTMLHACCSDMKPPMSTTTPLMQRNRVMAQGLSQM